MQKTSGRNLLFIIGVALFIILGLEVFFSFWTDLFVSILEVEQSTDTPNSLPDFFNNSEAITFIFGLIFNGLFYYLVFFGIYKGIKNNLKEKK